MMTAQLPRKFSASTQNNTLTLEVYDAIGADLFSEGITVQAVADALKTAHDQVVLRINSPGGDAFEGVAIYNALRANGKPVSVFVDGLAASAASIVAMAGDNITMGKGSMMMIHAAVMLAIGNAETMRKSADVLDSVT